MNVSTVDLPKNMPYFKIHNYSRTKDIQNILTSTNYKNKIDVIMLYGGHTYLFPVLHIGPDPGIASMLFSHQVLINALLDVAHHKQGSTHVTHLHSLLRLI